VILREQYMKLGSHSGVNHVLLFENREEVVEVSNPHPHCQIYATNFVFKFIETEARLDREHFEKTGRILFQDILAAEREDDRRIIFENSSTIAFMPYFTRYAYECFVAPKTTHPNLGDPGEMNSSELRDFAEALKTLLVRYDNLWQMPFPYV